MLLRVFSIDFFCHYKEKRIRHQLLKNTLPFSSPSFYRLLSIGNVKSFEQRQTFYECLFSSTDIPKLMTSPSDSIKPSSTSSKNNRITRANTFVIKSFDVDQDKEQLNKFLSNSQLEDFSLKTKFDITPETINHLNRQQSTIQRRPRIQWIKRHASFQTNSLTDFQTVPMTDRINPSFSITDLNDEYQNLIPDDQTLKYTSIPVLTSEDDDESISDENDQELLSDLKVLVDQASQAVLTDPKPKKKTKSSDKKKSTPSPRRAKQTTNVSQTPASPNRVSSNGDLTTLTSSLKASASIPKSEDNNGVKSLITVDTSKARSNLDVVRSCIRELGWKECTSGTTLDSDIYWHSASYHEGTTTFAFTSGRVNKFPGMNDLLRKVHLTRSLNNMRLLFPNDYNFYPKTWFLPEQNQQFKDDVRYIHQLDKKHNRSLTTFIVKPSDGSQGEGIYLLRDPAHIINTNRPHVVQEYIERPLLINGLKFDLRIYVLILNLYPLEIFYYNEGLVRFATIDYKAPTTDNLHQTYMHLTNYSLNKRSANYKHTVDDKQTDGSKRKLSLVWEQLSQMFGNDKIEHTKSLVIELINKTIIAILPELRVEYEFELPLGKKQHISCFQIIGFDIILNDKLKPILLEVNSNPSLRIDFDKENEAGKLVYQPSLIDEEIKKPLILETLKLALPKKKLNTIARHAKSQANDEVMAQRVEKVAQRRVEERNEKMKNARKTRFDMKLNPFFSRPLDSIAKEFERQHYEQQQYEQNKLHNFSPTHPILLGRSNDDITPYAFNNYTHTEPMKKVMRKTKSFRHSSTDDNESGLPTTITVDTLPSANIKRSLIKSGSTRTTTDAAMIRSIHHLKLIFPSNHKTQYQHLFLVDKIAYIYIQLVVILGYKTMTGGQFRSFANVCGIINETISAPSIDILYYQMLRKWQQFVLRTTSTGLPFAAFIEAFFLLSQRKFPSAHNLLDSVHNLVNTCLRHLNVALQTPISPVTYQSNQYLLHRSARNNSTLNSSSLNIRSTSSSLRSSTTTPIHRPLAVPLSPSAAKDHNHQMTSSAKSTDDKTKSNSLRQSAKSVFPLFFDVL